MNPYCLIVARASALAMLLLLLGNALAKSVAHYGENYAPFPSGAYALLTILGICGIAGLWAASTYGRATPVALGTGGLLLAEVVARGVLTSVSWFAVASYVLIIVGALVLAFGRGKSYDQVPLTRYQR